MATIIWYTVELGILHYSLLLNDLKISRTSNNTFGYKCLTMFVVTNNETPKANNWKFL